MDYDTDTIFPRVKVGRDRQLREIFRHGKVIDRKHSTKRGPLVRVQYLDRQGLISRWIPVKQFGSRSTMHYYCPKIGDDVNVVMLTNSAEHGFVDGSFFNEGNPPPQGVDVDTRHFQAADGTIISYSETNSTFILQNQTGPAQVTANPVTITSPSTITLTAPTIILSGNIQHTGGMNTTGVHIDANGKHKSTTARDVEELTAEVDMLRDRIDELEAQVKKLGIP